MESLYGQTVEYTVANGSMANSMEKELTLLGQERKNTENGKMAKDPDGLVEENKESEIIYKNR